MNQKLTLNEKVRQITRQLEVSENHEDFRLLRALEDSDYRLFSDGDIDLFLVPISAENRGIDPEKVRWETPEQKILVYRFAESENNNYTFTLNLGVEDDIVKEVQFFSPVQSDEVNSQRTKLFFLILIAIADDTLDKDGRENILTNLGLYDQVENPYQVGGTVSQNKIRYLIEPSVDNGLLIGLNFKTTQLDS